MTIETVMNYVAQYGIIIIFVIIFLEHLNMPGLPAGVIMPAVGVMVSKRHLSFILAMIICLLAGILGNIVLYVIGYLGGEVLFDYIEEKFPNMKKALDKTSLAMNDRRGSKRIMLRLLPVVRTMVSMVEGGMKVNFFRFIMSASIGIGLFNFIFITSGYFFGQLMV